ncbi:hypothetical protein CRUP_003416 [Coryphaenoides rupestris]|nr:hypothetical protein CRUP_003416 [Coryphaenoides rupestris]
MAPVLLPVLQAKAKRGPPRQAKYAIHCIHAMFTNRDTHFAQIFEPLHKGLDPGNLEQLITPLTTLGHLALLAPEQFAAPLKSLVANFIVKDLLMNDRIAGKKTTKLWVPDDEVSAETMAKVRAELCSSSPLFINPVVSTARECLTTAVHSRLNCVWSWS